MTTVIKRIDEEYEDQVKELNTLVKTYDGLVKLMTSTKNRLQSMGLTSDQANKDALFRGDQIYDQGDAIAIKGLNAVKSTLITRIRHGISEIPIWKDWMVEIPGIGETTAAKLILLYYYKFVSVCPKCKGPIEKKAVETDTGKKINTLYCPQCEKVLKGQGNLNYQIFYKDFPTISSWWAYMGRHIVDGRMPNRKKNVQSNWSTKGRTVTFTIGDQFNRQRDPAHPYKAFMEAAKAKHWRKNTDREVEWTKNHIHKAGRNEVGKLFLSHFWQVAHEMAGEEVTEPYVGKHLGHDIIPPYYWTPSVDREAKAA